MITNANMIHELKRNCIQEICNIADISGIVKRLIIFGSTVTENCTENSDIDICVDTDCEDKDRNLFQLYSQISKACDYDCDILTYRKLGETLKKEVNSKGVIVYEHKKC